DIEHVNLQLSNLVFSAMNILASQYATLDAIDLQRIQDDLKTIETIDGQLKSIASIDPQQWIRKNVITQNIEKEADEILVILNKLNQATTTLQQYVTIIPGESNLQNIVSHIDQLELWINYKIYLQKGNELKLDWFLTLAQDGKINNNDLHFEFVKILHLNHFVQAMNEHIVLNSFDADVYNAHIAQYKKLHKELIALSKQQLIMKLSAKIPNFS